MAPFLQYLFGSLAVFFFILLVTSHGRRLLAHLARTLLNGKSPLRWLAGLLAGVLPPVCWTLAFKLARNIPSGWRPTIHTHLLPVLELSLLSTSGIIFLTLILSPFAVLLRSQSRKSTGRILYPTLIVCFPIWLKAMNVVALGTTWTPFQDVLAWIFYGVLHFASPFLAGWWIWGFGPPGAAIVYGMTLGAQNLCGLGTHLIFPNAAPWYYDAYPADTIPTYDFPGNPAGLVRVDQALGTHLYRAAFKKSPVVFGALPSLHAASATCFSFYVARYGGKWGHIIMFIYSTMMFWSTQYLHHHFAVDLLMGTLYSVIAFSIACIWLRKLEAKHEKEASTRGVDRLFNRPSPHASSSTEERGTTANGSVESFDMEELKAGSAAAAQNSNGLFSYWLGFGGQDGTASNHRSQVDEEKATLMMGKDMDNDEDGMTSRDSSDRGAESSSGSSSSGSRSSSRAEQEIASNLPGRLLKGPRED